jgi:hypothetical protein
MMRMVKLVIALVLAWSLYWLVSGMLLRQSLSGWFEAQAARGWQAEVADLSTSGFPLRHVTRLESPALADPATGTAWQADWLELDSPAIWPGQQTLRFAETPQYLSYFDQTVILTAEGMAADLHLRPGAALQVQRMALTAGPWVLADRAGPLAGAATLALEMDQLDRPETYTLRFAAEDFTPGARLRDAVAQGDGLPPGFETLELAMTVAFDRPWDRSALEERRPQPVAIDLALAELQWGPMRLKATGAVTVDAAGVPEGRVTLKAENWREMLALAQASGALPAVAAASVETALSLLARIGGNPDALDVDLDFQGGLVALGPLTLGPAPLLILR